MYHPTTRLLTVLELLQSRGDMSGRELARILGVEERSIRRYMMMLRDMGIPVEGERGRHGGYSLTPGFRLPPMMFNADELTAVTLGLMLMRELGSASSPAIESAEAKIRRVLPAELRAAAEALRQALVIDELQSGTHPLSSEWIVAISRAIHERKCLHIGYRLPENEMTGRDIAPYGLVLHARTWYIPAYCHLREEIRIFRADRIQTLDATDQPFMPPEDFDARAFVTHALASNPNGYAAEILLHIALPTAREIIPASMAILEAAGDDTLMRCYSDDMDWLARTLIQTQLRFTVIAPDALREALRGIASDILAGLSAGK